MQPDTVDAIRAWHRERCFAMEQRKRINLALGAYVRTRLGWSMALPDAERKKIAARAAATVKKPADEFANIVSATKLASEPFEDIEKHAVKEMDAMARSLPAWASFGADIRGFGPGSLAVIVGEAGDLSNYSTHSKLWKRLGLAVFDGQRQGQVEKGLSKEDRAAAYIAHGYSPQRRSRIWNIGDSLIKGNKDGVYRAVYLERKKYELARDPEMRPIKAHRRAQRYMEKRLLKHLWQAWRACKMVSTVSSLPAEIQNAPQGAGEASVHARLMDAKYVLPPRKSKKRAPARVSARRTPPNGHLNDADTTHPRPSP